MAKIIIKPFKSEYEKKIQLVDLLNDLERETKIKERIEENLNKKYDKSKLISDFYRSSSIGMFNTTFGNPFGGPLFQQHDDIIRRQQQLTQAQIQAQITNKRR